MQPVLHVLDHSLPDQDGYATRSHSILSALGEFGVAVQAMTGPKQQAQLQACEAVDGVSYHRVITGSEQTLEGVLGQLRTVLWLRKGIQERLSKTDVGIIHAHSPCLNGLAAMGLGRPLVYEMRSSWEDAAVSMGVTKEGSARYRASRWLETMVARQADAVVVICAGLRDELCRRGISADKIYVVPNALPERLFDDLSEDDGIRIRRNHRLEGKKVIGFFGSFFEWEGIDDLIRAMPDIVERVPEARLLIAGGGRQELDLIRLSAELDLGSIVTFAGRVSSSEISAYYDAADVMVFPRRGDRLTNMVTPLKPLEAMARNKIVVASDVGGHRELIEDGRTGFLYPTGDKSSLVKTVVNVLVQQPGVGDMATEAKRYVTRERRWRAVSKLYLPIYEALRAERKPAHLG